MPEKAKKEHKCSHHVAAANAQPRNTSWWHKYHFSGKVIMCSVLFGLGLVLVGGISYAIGMDRTEEPDKNNLDEIQNKAPMSIVGPVVMGIGSFTVIVGIVMCLFETSICRRRASDSTPLIDEQGTSSTVQNTDPNGIPSTSKKSEKHKRHKTKRYKSDKNKYLESGSVSPSSKPIEVHRSASRDFTSSENFLTPPSSFVPESNTNYSNQLVAENQTSASLMKSFTSSGKSWNTSTEFQTPSSSFEDTSWSYGNKNLEAESSSSDSSHSAKSETTTIENLQHNFLTPQNSSAGLLDLNTENSNDKSSNLSQTNSKMKPTDELKHEFITPINSYVEKNTFPQKDIKEEVLKILPVKNEISNVSSNSEEKNLTSTNLDEKKITSQNYNQERNINNKEFTIKNTEVTGTKTEIASSKIHINDVVLDKNLIDSKSQSNLSSNEHTNDLNQPLMANKCPDIMVNSVEMSSVDTLDVSQSLDKQEI